MDELDRIEIVAGAPLEAQHPGIRPEGLVLAGTPARAGRDRGAPGGLDLEPLDALGDVGVDAGYIFIRIEAQRNRIGAVLAAMADRRASAMDVAIFKFDAMHFFVAAQQQPAQPALEVQRFLDRAIVERGAALGVAP